MDQQIIGIGPLKPEEQSKLEELSVRVNQIAPTLVSEDRVSKYTDKSHLVRVLIAREWKVQQAFDMWKKWVEWRLLYRADEIKPEEIQTELDLKKAYWHGQDKLGNPTLIIKGRRHFPGQSSQETLIRFFIYIIEQGIVLADKAGTGKITVIYDREGVTSKNFDSSMFKTVNKIIQILQDNYAERVHMNLVLYPNFFAKTILAIVKPFLSERSKKKFVLLDNPKQLLQYFNEDQLLPEHGGSGIIQDDSTVVPLDEVEDKQLHELAEKLLAENHIEDI